MWTSQPGTLTPNNNKQRGRVCQFPCRKQCLYVVEVERCQLALGRCCRARLDLRAKPGIDCSQFIDGQVGCLAVLSCYKVDSLYRLLVAAASHEIFGRFVELEDEEP